MKWENRDINVAETPNIPKFSKLDEIVNPLELLELFLDDVLVDIIVGCTKLYTHKERADNSFEITNKNLLILKHAA